MHPNRADLQGRCVVSGAWLEKWVQFRTTDWTTELDYPEYEAKEIQKFKQYSDEKDEVTESIKKHSNASTGFLNLGVSIYELSQRAKEIYLAAKGKDMVDEQRALIRFVFGSLIVDEGKLSYTYSKTFKILS